jgi:hypothetical protein
MADTDDAKGNPAPPAPMDEENGDSDIEIEGKTN